MWVAIVALVMKDLMETEPSVKIYVQGKNLAVLILAVVLNPIIQGTVDN